MIIIKERGFHEERVSGRKGFRKKKFFSEKLGFREGS